MEVIVEEVQIATACQYADLTGGTQSAPCRFAHAKSHNLGAPTTSRNFNGSNLSHRRNFAGDRNREIVVPYSMINRVRLSPCWWKTVVNVVENAAWPRTGGKASTLGAGATLYRRHVSIQSYNKHLITRKSQFISLAAVSASFCN